MASPSNNWFLLILMHLKKSNATNEIQVSFYFLWSYFSPFCLWVKVTNTHRFWDRCKHTFQFSLGQAFTCRINALIMQLFFSLARIIGLFVTYIGQWQMLLLSGNFGTFSFVYWLLLLLLSVVVELRTVGMLGTCSVTEPCPQCFCIF